MAEAAVLAGLGWVASPVITKLVNKSSSYLGSNITKDLEDLETILQPQIQRTIEAAEHSRHKDLFAGWLARLKNAYLDAEAILHDLEYEHLKCKAQGEGKKLLGSLSSKPIFNLLSAQKRKLLKRLKELKKVAAEAKTLRELLSQESTQSTQNAGDNPFATTPLLGNADRVFGRDGDREKIIKFLLDEQGSSSSSTKSYSVIAITGMGGVGKTTLAQYVYNDERVKKYFGVRMWISLSQNMDIIKHTKEMIEFASGKRPNLDNLSKLQEELVETLPGNIKVMVVLDNVWYDNNDGAERENQWENLLKPFHSRGGICKIVVTSRQSRSFPIDLQPGEIIQLSDLTPDDFRSLLRYRAIDGLQINDPQTENDLSDIVDQIAKKMTKLPLAAKVVGNQLRQQPYITFWRDTLGKVNLSNITEILLWSFRRLDVQLQRCFSFCSVFPKGTNFNNTYVVPYWVALDFIQPSNDNRSVEDIGLEYFEIMKANSIFHPVGEWYIMHDLFHDLAEKLSIGDCFRITKAQRNIPQREIPQRKIPSTVQHIWFELNNDNLKENLSSIRKLSNLRTLILENPFIDDISEIIQEISTNFRNLRVLHVYSKGYKTLPKVIGDLRNLRFLDIASSSIEKLPDSVVQLYHLQFVWLPSSLKTLPTKLTNFIQLRSIKMYNSYGSELKTLPPVPYLGKLTSLQSLNEFHVSKEQGFELQQLEPLKEIRGSLRIVNLENVKDKNEAGQASLVNKSKLKSLELVWTKSAENGSEIAKNDLEIIKALQPPENLECLTIDGYRGSTCNPTWLEEGSYIKYIQDVRFYNCNALTNLPQSFHQFHHCSQLVLKNLGALSALSTFPENLTSLKISQCGALTALSAFPENLTSLKISKCGALRELSIFPENLTRLKISKCGALRELPIFPENLTRLKISKCRALRELSIFPENLTRLKISKCGALRELPIFPKNLARLSIIRCPILIFVYEIGLQVNENQNMMERFLQHRFDHLKEILDDELKSFEQTGSKENCVEQFRIIENTVQGNAPEDSLNVYRAWWSCHQQRMKFIFGCNTRANELKLPTRLRILDLAYCCVSDGALSNCLIGMVTLDELYLTSIMTITTLPCAEVLKSLKRLKVLQITNCWYLSSLGGLHALPLLQIFRLDSSWCLEMDSNFPPTLQSLTIEACQVTPDVFNGNLRYLETVEIINCLLPSSLSFPQLTSLQLLALFGSPSCFSIHGLESRPHISTLHLVLLPNLDVESVLQSWQGCQTLWISNSEMMNKLLSSQNFDPPSFLGIKYCDEEEISFEESNHLRSIKKLQFYKCKTKNLPKTLSDFSTLEEIYFIDCPEISRLPELPGSVKYITIKGCPVLRERCLPNGSDWNKIKHIQDRDWMIQDGHICPFCNG